MRSNRVITVVAFVLIYGYSPALHSQTNNPKFLFGVGAGTFIYQGDLTPTSTGSYKTMKPVINLFAGKFFSPSLSGRIQLAFGGLKGDESKYEEPDYRQQRNLNFTTPVTEISALGEWNILGRNYVTRGFSPYVFAGVGFSFLRIRRDWSQVNREYFTSNSAVMQGLARDTQISVPRGLLNLPAGIGARFYLSDRIGITAETSYRFMNTDYLDGFSHAANPGKKDNYYSHTIGIVYRIGKKNFLDCPVVKY